MPVQSALVLPPGVAPPSRPPSAPGIAFDREFFEKVLPGAVQAYCSQVACTFPVVELRTIDGARFYIRAISAVSDTWVALHTQDESDDEASQVFLPYAAILRVEIHPDLSPEMRRVGFLVSANRSAAAAELEAGTAPSPADEQAQVASDTEPNGAADAE